MAETITVLLVVDDQPLVRAGLATILGAQQDLRVVGEAADGAEAVAAVHALRPDVVCMDVQMPDLDGIEATRRIVADPAVTTRVLMLTTFQREDYLLAALRAGASGFLLKNARPAQLADAVRAVAAGDSLLAPEVTRSLIERAVAADPAPGAAGPVAAGAAGEAATAAGAASGTVGEATTPAAPGTPREVATLTERELEVLRLVARGLSNDEIAAELFLGRATVKTHVSNLLMKLDLRDRVQAVVFAHEHGLTR